MSIKVQVIFCSLYGHVYKMAQAVVQGAKQLPGAEVSLYHLAELIPDDVLEKHGAKAAKAAFPKVPVATVHQLADAHTIIWHSNALRLATQMRNFLDQTGPLWAKGIADRKDRERVRFHRDATRRAGDHVDELPHHPPTSRHGNRRHPL